VLGQSFFENPEIEQWAGNLNWTGSSRIKKALTRVKYDARVSLASPRTVYFQTVTHQNIWRFILMNDP